MEASEIDILFPEIEVEGVKLRPWSLGQVADLAPSFMAIVKALRDSGIAFSEIEARMEEFVLVISPHAPKIISITAKIPEAEVREWPLAKATVVTMAILNQNVEHLKNSFGLVRAAAPKTEAT